MKILLLNTAMLLLAASSIAQLYVRPNSGASSFIYVDDEILFVEQGVQLTANPTGVYEASLYLRNQAQLIQGTSNTNNTGSGTLSVYQDSNSDSYDYNFWGSPVGVQTLGGGSGGNKLFGVANLKGITNNTESYVAGTTSAYNGTSTPLYISRRWMYKLVNSSWTAINNNAQVYPGQGFTMKGTDVTVHTDPFSDTQNQEYDFRGRANNGNIARNTVVGGDFLFGNPYPSAMDLNRVFYDADNSEITEFLYWDEDRSINSHLYTQNKGGYGTWVPGPTDPNGNVAGIYTAPTFLSYDQSGNAQLPTGGEDVGANYKRRMAPIGQGFLVIPGPTLGGDSSANQIIFKNSHRRYFSEGAANNSQYRGPAGAIQTGIDPVPTNESPYKYMRIFTSFDDTHYRDMVLAFDGKHGTDGFDRGLDGKHPMDPSSADAYFPITVGDEQEMFVIQTVDYDGEKHIPITFKVARQTDLKVQAAEEHNVPFEAAYLYDSDTNVYRIMTGDNVAEITLPTAGTYADRFFIVFKNNREAIAGSEGTRAQEEAIASVDFFQNNRVGQLEIGNPEGYDIASANIFDMGGRLVVSKVNLGSSRTFTFPTSNLSDGVYIVKLLTNDNFAIDHKITVYNNK